MNLRPRKLHFPPLRIYPGLLMISLAPLLLKGQASTGKGAAVPSSSEQDAMLTAMSQYAGQYISHLPNFICIQVTQQFEAGRKPTHWRKGDTLRSKLVFHAGSEERSIELVNDKPPGPQRRWRTPLTTEGEFGTLLGSVFSESTQASFTWRGWETVDGRSLAVFDFAVDRKHSGLSLGLSDLAHSMLPYRGSIFADPQTGEVWRISDTADNIPPEVRTKSISTLIEYGQVAIGGVKYLLPVRATVSLDTGSNNIRNELWFNEYRKFETDSSVTYTSDSQAAEPAKLNPPE